MHYRGLETPGSGPTQARTHLPLCSGVGPSLPFAPAWADLSLSETSQIGSPDKMQDAS